LTQKMRLHTSPWVLPPGAAGVESGDFASRERLASVPAGDGTVISRSASALRPRLFIAAKVL